MYCMVYDDGALKTGKKIFCFYVTVYPKSKWVFIYAGDKILVSISLFNNMLPSHISSLLRQFFTHSDIVWRLEVVGPSRSSDVTEWWEGDPKVKGKQWLIPDFGFLDSQICTFCVCAEDVVSRFRNGKWPLNTQNIQTQTEFKYKVWLCGLYYRHNVLFNYGICCA